MDTAQQIIWTMIAGGAGSWVAVRVQLALTEQTAKDAKDSAKDAHERLDRHISDLHTIRPK